MFQAQTAAKLGDEVAMETIELLQSRLERIAFYTTGIDDLDLVEKHSATGKTVSIQTRLQQAEDSLHKLTSMSQVVEEILSLYRSQGNIFPRTSQAAEPAAFSSPERLSIVKSCATLFPTTASRLTSIQDLPVPPTASSTNLIALHPRLASVEHLQDSQSQEIMDLRLRTASILQRWYEVGVLAQGECWTEWDERLMEVEKILRREESTRARDAAAM